MSERIWNCIFSQMAGVHSCDFSVLCEENPKTLRENIFWNFFFLDFDQGNFFEYRILSVRQKSKVIFEFHFFFYSNAPNIRRMIESQNPLEGVKISNHTCIFLAIFCLKIQKISKDVSWDRGIHRIKSWSHMGSVWRFRAPNLFQ